MTYRHFVCASLISGVHGLRSAEIICNLLLRHFVVFPKILYNFDVFHIISPKLLYQVNIFTIDFSKYFYYNSDVKNRGEVIEWLTSEQKKLLRDGVILQTQ